MWMVAFGTCFVSKFFDLQSSAIALFKSVRLLGGVSQACYCTRLSFRGFLKVVGVLLHFPC